MLRLRVFGGLALEGGGPVQGAATQRRPLALLAYLAVAGDRAVARDALLAMLWPESDLERARGALKQTLYALRRDTGEEALTLGTNELQLNTAVIASDVQDFERALGVGDWEDAVAQYRGPFLDSVHLKGSDEFERWTERERRRLSDVYRSALQTLARAATKSKDVLGAVAWTRRLVELEPLSPRFAREYMEALVAADDREAAVKHAAVYGALVRTELETEPDSALLLFVAELSRPSSPSNGPTKHDDRRRPEPVPTVVVNAADPSALPTTRNAVSSRRRFLLRGAAATILAAAILGAGAAFVVTRHGAPPTRPRHRIETTVVAVSSSAISSSGRPEDGPVSMLIKQALELEIAKVPGVRLSAPGEKADLSVRAQAVIEPESIRVSARIAAAEGDEQITVRVATGARSASLDVERRVARAAAGSIALGRSSFFGPVAALTSQPADYASVLAFTEADSRVASSFDRDSRSSIRELANAARADTSFTLPRLWGAKSLREIDDCAGADSLLTTLAERNTILPPFELRFAAITRARCRGEWDEALRHARALYADRPNSELIIATLAKSLLLANRPAEAVRVAESDPNRLDVDDMWGILPTAYHATANFRAEFAYVTAVDRRIGRTVYSMGLLIPPLAALGDEPKLARVVDEAEAMPPTDVANFGYVSYLAGVELSNHGRLGAASSYFRRSVGWFRADRRRTDSTRDKVMFGAALLATGENDAAQAVLRLAELRAPADVDVQGELGLVAVRKHDPASVSRIDGWLETQRGPFQRGSPSLWRARMAVEKGDTSRGAMLLKQAIADGLGVWGLPFSPGGSIHLIPGLEAILRDPTIAKLLAPAG